MNKFARDMLMAKYGKEEDRDRTSDGRRRDMNSDGNRDYNRDYRRDYDDRDYDRRGRDHDRRDYDDRDYRSGDYSRMDRADRDYNRDYDRERDYDRDYNRDYGETQYGKMSRKDIEKWKKSLKNNDGSHGEHYKKDQIEPIVKRLGIDVEQCGGSDIFCLAVNLAYADYCKVAKKYGTNHVEFYADMAKAFLLEDKDFMGEPEEKLWLYYKCIAESEE